MEITTAPEQQAEPATEVAATEPDAGGRLLDQFEQFTSTMGARFDALEQRIPEREPEPEYEDDFALDPADFGDDDFSDDGQLTAEAQQRALVDMMRQVVRAELAPREQAEADSRREAEADALEERYPELAKPEVQEAMIERAIAFARQVGKPELAQEPKLLEMVYLAEQASRRAGDEIPAGSGKEVRLETGTGAPPAASADKTDDGDRIVDLAKKSHFRVGS